MSVGQKRALGPIEPSARKCSGKQRRLQGLAHANTVGRASTTSPSVSFLWRGSAAGIVLLIGSVFLYSKPKRSQTWGLVIVCVAVLNIFVGMGSFLAAILGVIGDALAMSWKPAND